MSLVDDVVVTVKIRGDATGLAPALAEARTGLAGVGIEAETVATRSGVAGEALQGLSGNATKMGAEAESAATHSTSLERAFGRMGAAASEASGASGLGSMVKNLTGLSPEMLGFAAPVLAVGAALVISTKNAAEFDSTILKVANNTGMSKAGMESLRSSVLKLGADTSLSLDQVAGGYERAANAGFQGAQATTIVEQSMRATVETGGELSQTVDTVTGALKTFSLPASDAGKVLGILMTAAAEGDVRLPDLAQNFSKVGELAGAMHLPLSQTAAAFSDITRFTHNAAVAQTEFQGMLTHILSPTATAQKEIEALSKASGVDLVGAFKAVQNGTMDLTTFMTKAKEATHGNTQELMNLFGGIRGGQAALILMNQGWENYNTIAAKTAHSANLVDSQWSRTTKDLDVQMGILKNRITEISIGLGTDLVPVAGKAAGGLSDVAGQAISVGNSISFMNPVLETAIGEFANLLIKFNPISLGLEQVALGITATKDATHLAGQVLGQFNPQVSQTTALDQRRAEVIKQLEANLSSLSPHELAELDTLKKEAALQQQAATATSAHTKAILSLSLATQAYYSQGGGNVGAVSGGASGGGSAKTDDLQKAITTATAAVQHWADIVFTDQKNHSASLKADEAELAKHKEALLKLETTEAGLTTIGGKTISSLANVSTSATKASVSTDTLTKLTDERAALERQLQTILAAGKQPSQDLQNRIHSLSVEINNIQTYISKLEDTTKTHTATVQTATKTYDAVTVSAMHLNGAFQASQGSWASFNSWLKGVNAQAAAMPNALFGMKQSTTRAQTAFDLATPSIRSLGTASEHLVTDFNTLVSASQKTANAMENKFLSGMLAGGKNADQAFAAWEAAVKAQTKLTNEQNAAEYILAQSLAGGYVDLDAFNGNVIAAANSLKQLYAIGTPTEGVSGGTNPVTGPFSGSTDSGNQLQRNPDGSDKTTGIGGYFGYHQLAPEGSNPFTFPTGTTDSPLVVVPVDLTGTPVNASTLPTDTSAATFDGGTSDTTTQDQIAANTAAAATAIQQVASNTANAAALLQAVLGAVSAQTETGGIGAGGFSPTETMNAILNGFNQAMSGAFGPVMITRNP